MAKIPPICYETFGSVAHVIDDLRAHLPALFPDRMPDFLPALRALIEQNAAANQWDQVVLILAQGMARHVLDDMVEHPFAHKGNLVIDPTGSTPEHSVVETSMILKTNRERLCMVNEATEDILIVLYGMDVVDRSSDFHLLQRHLRMAGASLDLMMEEDPANYNELLSKNQLDQSDRQIRLAKDQLMILNQRLDAFQRNPDDPAYKYPGINPQLQALYSTMTNLMLAPENAWLQYTMQPLMYGLQSIPETYTHLGFNLEPYMSSRNTLNGGIFKLKHELTPQERLANELIKKQRDYRRKLESVNPQMKLDPD